MAVASLPSEARMVLVTREMTLTMLSNTSSPLTSQS